MYLKFYTSKVFHSLLLTEQNAVMPIPLIRPH